MKITALKLRKPIFIILLLNIFYCSNAALAKPRFVPIPDNPNSMDKTPAIKITVVEHATRQFEEAMRRWDQGLYGALLFFHKTKGPLTDEFKKIIELDPDLPRMPVYRNTECVTCNAEGDCDAVINIQFNTETAPKLRVYHLRSREIWGLYSEARLKDSPAFRSALASCKAGSQGMFFDYILEEDAVRLAFEKTMRAYRDENWNVLLPLLAAGPNKTIREQLAKPDGEQELLQTGRLPVTWEFNCAIPASRDAYHVYAWMANRNQNGKLQPFRFIFTADPSKGRWQLAESNPLSESEYFMKYGRCIDTQERGK